MSKISRMSVRIFLITAIAFVWSAPARSHEFRYTGYLTGSAESPPNASTGFGHAVVTLDEDLITLRVQTNFTGLQGTVTAAHIHAPTSAAGAGTAGVATQVPTFSDFPLGNPCGKPKDKASQTATLALALRVLETAPGPRTTVQNPIRWNADGLWKLDFSNVDQLSKEEVARRRAEFDKGKEIAKQRLAEDRKKDTAG